MAKCLCCNKREAAPCDWLCIDCVDGIADGNIEYCNFCRQTGGNHRPDCQLEELKRLRQLKEKTQDVLSLLCAYTKSSLQFKGAMFSARRLLKEMDGE